MNNRGFTLIEIVTVIIVLGIIGAFTMSFLIDNSKTYQMMRVQRELYQDGVYVMERISRELRDVRGTHVSCGGYLKTNTSRDTNLCLIYSQSGTDLLRNNVPIARDLQINGFNLSFDAATNKFTVSITLEKDCSLPNNQKCSVTLTGSVLAVNYCTNNSPNPAFAGFPGNPCNTSPSLSYDGRSYNGDYEEVIVN
jgi:prepilin-type N-terminal cleavage/methylation domain-containing protein